MWGGPRDGKKVALEQMLVSLDVVEKPPMQDVYEEAIYPQQCFTKSTYLIKFFEIEMLDVVWRYAVYLHESLNPHLNTPDVPDVRRTHVKRFKSHLTEFELVERDRKFNEERAYGWIDFCIRTGRRPDLETFTNAVAHTVKGIERELRCRHLLTMEPN